MPLACGRVNGRASLAAPGAYGHKPPNPEVRTLRRIALAGLAAVALAAPAFAHDLWLQTPAFWIAPGGVAQTAVWIGHAQDRERWSVDPRRVLSFRSVSARGTEDRLAELRASQLRRDTPLRFATPGTHLLSMESSHAVSELPAIRFNDYLVVEGLTPAQQLRARNRTTDHAGREIYSRRAKMLLQVGRFDAAAQAHVTRPLGMTLEIVPEQSPYGLRRGQPLSVRVLYQGRPLQGGLVKLYDLASDERPVATARSDAAGRATFPMPGPGAWLLNVVWTRPITGDPRGDFDTTFSSLSFGVPAGSRQ